MKQITITVPDNCELKKDGNTYIIVEKEKKLTYEDVARDLFYDNPRVAYFDIDGVVSIFDCISEKQAEKLLAINKLMNVAKYLNGDWQPDWDKTTECKYYISPYSKQLKVTFTTWVCGGNIYFKSEELAKQAIEILGEETIKLALCTDY